MPDAFLPDDLPAPTVDVFRDVLARHRRRQARVFATAGSAILLAAGVAGFAVGRSGDAGSPVAAGTPPAAATPTAAAVGAGTAAPAGGSSSQVLLRNAADGVRIRLYIDDVSAKFSCTTTSSPGAPSSSVPASGGVSGSAAGSTSGSATGSSSGSPPSGCPTPPPACVPTGFLTAEVSDDQVAGATGAPLWQTPTAVGYQAVDASVVGPNQPQPILVVTGHAGSAVASVRLTTAYGTDTQAVSGGWSALAVQLPADYQATADHGTPAGTVTALSPTGAVLSTTDITTVNPKPSPPCEPTCPAGGQPAAKNAKPVCSVQGGGTVEGSGAAGAVSTQG